MQRMPEPDTVKSITGLTRPDQAGNPLTCGNQAIKAGGLLKTGYQLHGERGFPRPAGLNRRTSGREHGCKQRK
jgi:hypothetical protein